MYLDNQNSAQKNFSKEKERNSSIELLRVISMFAILLHHLVVHNIVDYRTVEPDIFRFALLYFFQCGGKVAVAIFFIISAWFLADSSTDIKTSLRRVWNLEKEVLFYSSTLGVCCYFTMGDVGAGTLIRCLFPLIASVWWYTSAYAGFLVVFPFLTEGLRVIGRKKHFTLCAVLLFAVGVIGILPVSRVVTGVLGMMYLYTLIAAYKWYLAPIQPLDGTKLIVAGALLLFPLALVSLMAEAQSNGSASAFIVSETKIPILFLGFGFFLLFQQKNFYSPMINKIASCSLAVYLITDFSPIGAHIWQGPFRLDIMAGSFTGFFNSIILSLCLYIACTTIDAMRQWLFSKGINAFWGRLFERLWRVLAIRGDNLLRKLYGLLGA